MGGDETRTRDLCRDSSRSQVLSTTWKSTDGTVSHWKYVIGNVIVYPGVYRTSRDLEGSALRSISFLNFSAAAPFPLTLTLRDPREWKTARGKIDSLHRQTIGLDVGHHCAHASFFR